jgi:hypothetical protein
MTVVDVSIDSEETFEDLLHNVLEILRKRNICCVKVQEKTKRRREQL